MPKKLTVASIRKRYPNPISLNEVTKQKLEIADRSKPPCYCVGGALLVATGEPWTPYRQPDYEIGARADIETLFPAEFAGALSSINPKLRDNHEFWESGNGSMSVCYESAIKGANDHDSLTLANRKRKRLIPDHFELAWQLLDDAFHYDSKKFDESKQLRLLTGELMYISTDSDYKDNDRPELVAYYQRHCERYLELTKIVAKGG